MKWADLIRWWKSDKGKPDREGLKETFRFKYGCFKDLLASNEENLGIISDIEEKLRAQSLFGMAYVKSRSARAVFHAYRMVKSLNALSGQKYPILFDALESISRQIKEETERRKPATATDLVLPLNRIGREMVHWVGGKSANLGEVQNRVHLPTPEGFAITTLAFESFLAHEELVEEINKRRIEIEPDDPEKITRVSEDIQALIRAAEVPPSLEAAILSAYDELDEKMRKSGRDRGACRVSMRSSAIGEDSELTFAGQYASVLNVPREKLIETYKHIVASLYTPRAITYRLSKGIRVEDVLMCVACMTMVESVASGIAYSRDPLNPLDDRILITGVWGLGPYAVGGVITPDTFRVSKKEGFPIDEMRVSLKPVRLVSSPEVGLQEVPVPVEQQGQPCLSIRQVRVLAGYMERLAGHFGSPQDVEWALDGQGTLLVLQARPLRLEAAGKAGEGVSVPRVPDYPLLVEEGAVASPGIGFGPAFHVRSDEDLLHFPPGAVLVAKHASPKFVLVMRKAQAIVTDSGSITGHMACLAREFSMPAVLDAGDATTQIPQGMEVTVDAYSGRVYQGRVRELEPMQKPRVSQLEGTPVYETLKRIARLITPLNLLDPQSPDFNPQSCRSLHDIMRFAHEVSYTEMFLISETVSKAGEGALKMDIPIPLDLHVIDLGNGLAPTHGVRKRVGLQEVLSRPFQALLKGMTDQDLRVRGEPRPIEIKGLLSVMSEQMFSNPHVEDRFGERSYALISDRYMNFSSRVGYHYGVLDSYCGETRNKNYITFSFKGGAADDVRRNRRARAIARILESLDFTVEVKVDMVTARLQKCETPVTEERLEAIGRLLQFTRQMDMLMAHEATVETVARCFLQGNYACDLSARGGTEAAAGEKGRTAVGK
ncbi:MAG: PEP/pyruvate-binding domain-containing protein [Thermodesulfobacteriota bacterium]